MRGGDLQNIKYKGPHTCVNPILIPIINRDHHQLDFVCQLQKAIGEGRTIDFDACFISSSRTNNWIVLVLIQDGLAGQTKGSRGPVH